MAWTKVNTIVVGVGVLLVAGTTTVSVKQYETYQAARDSWRIPNPTTTSVAKAMPQVRILPTKFKAPVHGQAMAGGGRWVGVNVPVSGIVRAAYQWPPGRIDFPAGEPNERYDFASTLPQGTEEALQEKLKTTLGLVGRREIMDTDVWMLKVRRPDAPGLAPHNIRAGVWDWSDIGGRIQIMGEPLSWTPPQMPRGLTKYLEMFLHRPVIDETGLKGNYDIDLKWNEDGVQDPDHDALKKAVLDQLGLELVPSTRPIEMLVVERAK